MQSFEKYDLSSQNTFRMKVSCERFIEYGSLSELQSIDFGSLPRPLLHIGAGSNLLFTGDFPGTVLHSAIKYIKYVDMGLDDVPVLVGAGVRFDDFVAETCGHGLWGAENLSLIPGEMGAAAVQNIGAYGVEVKDIISGVSCFDIQERKSVKFRLQDCGYGYRDSFFKTAEAKGRYIVTSVLLRLSRKPLPRLGYGNLSEVLEGTEVTSPLQVREAVIRLRNEKLPDPALTGSAGSFFKNPVVSVQTFAKISEGYKSVPHYLLSGGMVKIPAAWLIEQCSLKGCCSGGAKVWERQPLVIVNASGDAAPSDILSLEKHIQDLVMERFGIFLTPEVEHI